MKITTADSRIFIIEQQENRVVYDTNEGEQWEITGKCIACGACEVGVVDTYYEEIEGEKMPAEKHYQIWTGVPVGQPGACFDVRYGDRLDIPIRPELTSKFISCTLSGRYLNGH